MALKRFLLVIFMSVLAVSLLLTSSPREQKTPIKTILTNCNIIDCTGNEPLKNMSVVIVGNTITDILQGTYKKSVGEKNVRILNLENGYVLPGLWNVHMHMAALLPDPNHLQDDESLPSAVIRAGLNAMDGLRFGVTSIRTVGERSYLDIAWRDAFDSGYFMGPRIFASGDA